MRATYSLALLAALAASPACSVHGEKTPPLTGPSEYATSITVTATPDSIAQDGASQASIVVVARDASARAISDLVIGMQMSVNGVVRDYGTLSTRSIVTGADGRATVVYTAPPPAASFGDGPPTVTIRATPVASNYQTSQTQTAAIRLMPPGVVLPPSSAFPTANFIGPADNIELGKSANFDAAASCAAKVACEDANGITSYAWSFGDGGSSGGQKVSHTYVSPGTFVVTLTVTNEARLSESVSKAVTVTIPKPTAVFVISPTEPAPLQPVFFNASGSTVALGHSLIQYIWDFGRGQPPLPGSATETYPGYPAGKYTVVLTVVDDTGQRATTSKEFEVKVPTPAK